MTEVEINKALNQAAAAHRAGKIQDAIRYNRIILKFQPKHSKANHNLGTLAVSVGQAEKALTFFKTSLETNFNSAQAWHSYIDCFNKLERFDEAQALLTSARAKGASGDAFDQLQNKLDEVKLEGFDELNKMKPHTAELYNNMGNILKNQGKLDEAIAAYQHAIKIKPGFAEYNYNIGLALNGQGKMDEAIEAYQQAIVIKPDFAEAYCNMGITLKNQFKLHEAIAACQMAIEIDPEFSNSYIAMGSFLEDQGKLGEAIAANRQALKIKPGYEAYFNIGAILHKQGKLDEAIEAYRKTLKIKPEYEAARAQMFYLLKTICDFSVEDTLRKTGSTLGRHTEAVSPFTALSWVDAPEQQLERSRLWASETFNKVRLSLPPKPSTKPKRLKIGYLSADFKVHPVAYLISKVFELHDRSKFDVFGYSISPVPDSGIGAKIINSFDVFKDFNRVGDKEAAKEIIKDKVDILIDLTGYTRNSRSNILSFRAAPIQINYLGFPGSMGADFIDYIVADSVVIPDNQRAFYSESCIYLPDSYQPTDEDREIARTATIRADFGLPDDAFVFCSFNNSFKINSQAFDIWMGLLRKVNDSVLWLLDTNKWAVENLRKRAAARGIDSSRIIFAERMSQAEHLARHKHADLFIDCFNYNAHTTASDALWAGLPVVTKQGQQFAARVAASILTAVGLPELITETDEDYERLILELATNAPRLSAIKAKLATNRLKAPLFDTRLYTQHFEVGLVKAYDLYFTNQKARDIWVSDGE